MDKQLKKIVDLIGFRSFLISVLLLTAFLQFFLMLGNVLGVTYDIQLTELAPETIRSVKTVEDTVKTEQERTVAGNAVEPVYVFHDEIGGHRETFVTTIFDIAIDVKTELSQMEKPYSREERISLLRNKLKDIIENQESLTITDTQLESLLTASEVNLQNARDILTNLVEGSLKKPIRKENLTAFRNEFESKIRQQISIDESVLNVVITIGRAAIVETELLDEEKKQR